MVRGILTFFGPVSLFGLRGFRYRLTVKYLDRSFLNRITPMEFLSELGALVRFPLLMSSHAL